MTMLAQCLFYIVILLSNIIQGITGFAGTILAMPPGLMLVGYDIAKPVLNVLGLLSGVYVFAGNRSKVNWRELGRIVLVMALGIFAAFFIRGLFAGREQALYRLLGIFVLILSVQGLLGLARPAKQPADAKRQPGAAGSAASYGLLALAGVIHGLFVSGGPLLISYLTRRVTDKAVFRATISTTWIFLNGIILLEDIRAGLWTGPTIIAGAVSLPFLFAGMFIGSKLYARMSQLVFMKLTYLLLFISGLSLLVK